MSEELFSTFVGLVLVQECLVFFLPFFVAVTVDSVHSFIKRRLEIRLLRQQLSGKEVTE